MSTNAKINIDSQINNTSHIGLGHITASLATSKFRGINSIPNRIFRRLRLKSDVHNSKISSRNNKIRDGYAEEEVIFGGYPITNRAMMSFSRIFNGSNEVAIHDKMIKYAANNKFGDTQKLIADADAWLNSMQTDDKFRFAKYMTNFGSGRVQFTPDPGIYTFCLNEIRPNAKKPKSYKRYMLAYREHELRELQNGIGEMYRPDMWGKDTDISMESPSEWVYYLKAKNAFKARKLPLLETLRQDLRIYLNQKKVDITTKEQYQLFIAAIVNAYIPNQIDMYAQNMLSSKHISSGINKYNDATEGDMEREVVWPESRKHKGKASTIL